MDNLGTHIKELEDKINSLYQLVERIGTKVNTLSEQKQTTSSPYSMNSFSAYSEQNGGKSNGETAYSISHKDVLLDDSARGQNNTKKEKDLAPEIQIRRLTAQLTAAYNRIAALEEQLLTYRIKS